MKLRMIIKTIAPSTFFIALPLLAAPSKSDSIEDYKMAAQSLIENITRDQSKSEDIQNEALRLTGIGRDKLKQLMKSQPQCEPVLAKVAEEAFNMTKLSHEKIESDYHNGKALAKSNDPICYELKELVVHPATVVILSKDKTLDSKKREEMIAEIDEVLAHIDNVALLMEHQKPKNN